MRARYIAVLTLIVTLLSVGVVNSETVPEYISSVEIYVDGLVDASGVRILKTTLMQEEGVAEVTGDLERGIMAVIPKQDVGWVNLFNFVQRINGTRQYTVLKMDVVALGRVVKFPVDYYRGAVYAYSGDRYRLQIGDMHFLLNRNDKLDEFIDSEYEIARVTGTVTAFSDRVPIMQIREFKKPTDIEETELLKSSDTSPEMIQDYISSVVIQVDGLICSDCVRELESALKVEESIASITSDLETGTVIVIPKIDGEPIRLIDLVSRVSSTRKYTVRKMTVVAMGRIAKLPVKYHEVDVHLHSHDRYKLQVGSMHFILSENDNLDELVKSGHERVRVVGTVSAFNNRVPIMLIGYFEKPGEDPKSVAYDDPLDAISPLSVEETESIEENEGHPHIDSVRIYVDGLICGKCERIVQTDLMKEEGVKAVSTDIDLGLIEIIPEEGKMFDLHGVWQRINAMREFEALKMDVVASGEVIEVMLVDHAGTSHPHPHKRYKLRTGEFTGFVLSVNEKLKEILKSEDRIVAVIGTVTAFRGKIPILYISDYKKIEKQPHG